MYLAILKCKENYIAFYILFLRTLNSSLFNVLPQRNMHGLAYDYICIARSQMSYRILRACLEGLKLSAKL